MCIFCCGRNRGDEGGRGGRRNRNTNLGSYMSGRNWDRPGRGQRDDRERDGNWKSSRRYVSSHC